MRYRRIAIAAALSLAPLGLSVTIAPPASADLPAQCSTGVFVGIATCTFSGVPGASFEVVAPAGTHSAALHVVGRAGGTGTVGVGHTPVPGGSAAAVDGVVPAAQGDTFIAVFADNGGQGGIGAGDGGGSSVVTRDVAGGTQVETLAEAGGGGGAGAAVAESGDSTPPPSAGGAAGQAGMDGRASSTAAPARGGEPGQPDNSGVRGIGALVPTGDGSYVSFSAGESGSGSQGGDGGSADDGGGGGGGGRYGGGGGGAGGATDVATAYGAGGGGGSSTVPAGGTVKTTTESVVISITFLTDEVSPPPPPDAPTASYAPTALDFGSVPMPTTSSPRSVVLTNSGSVALGVQSVVIDSDPYSSFSVNDDNCSSLTLAPGESCEVSVVFHPHIRGDLTGRLRITDDSTTSPHSVSLRGYGTRPVAIASPETVVFEPLELGSAPVEKLVNLTNAGDADLHVSSVSLNGQAFSIDSDSCTGATLVPASSCAVTIGFQPTTVGTVGTYLTFRHDGGTDTLVRVQGTTTPPADLALRGVGSLYTGRDHLVTRAVSAAGRTQTYPVAITNEASFSRSYGIRLVTAGSPAIVQLRPAGWGAALTPGPDGNYPIGPILPGDTATYSLKVTPTERGDGPSTVKVVLLDSTRAAIESVSTETNVATQLTSGTTSYELFAKEGSQPFIGGPTDSETVTGPALNVGSSAAYTIRLRNNGDTAAQIGLRLTDADGCAGSFVTTAVAGTTPVTDDVYAGTFRTRLLRPGGYQDVRVAVRRATTGCPERLIRAESLDGSTVVRTSYLLANSAYDAATD